MLCHWQNCRKKKISIFYF